MKTDILIRYEGMKALRERLGPVEAEKFIVLIRREPFDYTEWQQTLWQDKSVDELFEIAKQQDSKEKKPQFYLAFALSIFGLNQDLPN